MSDPAVIGGTSTSSPMDADPIPVLFVPGRDRAGGEPSSFAATGTFVALDFETADRRRDSACALAIVRVEGVHVVASNCRLIRPPRRNFEFTSLHGISWREVRSQPSFGPIWRSMGELLEGAEFIAAHNASFDRGVLDACCAQAKIARTELRFECTVALARRRWNLFPTRLPDVCRFLGVPLKHHDALSDAMACARIVIAARAINLRPTEKPAFALSSPTSIFL